MEHEFTKKIKDVLKNNFENSSDKIFSDSLIIQYLNLKTKSASKGSKSRGSFGNLYAIYVVVEDYIEKKYHETGNYKDYKGAIFSDLFKRQRELPFGQKLQNHALNHRMNQEFKKYFPLCSFIPIIRDANTNRYWFNENLLKIKIGNKKVNIAKAVIKIIDEYILVKQDAFNKFIEICQGVHERNKTEKIDFIKNLLKPNIDARIFEIVSYCILKYYYHNKKIYWGFEIDKIQEDNLKLFKTGRTSANDGGIDFVMKPLGRFFQVTETVDVNKYFLDIDKIERYPITFVVKSIDSVEELNKKIRGQAGKQYSITAIVNRYMNCIEEIINIPILLEKFLIAIKDGYLENILNEIIKQSKVEFNIEDDFDLDDDEE